MHCEVLLYTGIVKMICIMSSIFLWFHVNAGNGAPPYYPNPNSQPPPGNGASPYYPNPNSQPPPGNGAPPYYPNPNSQPPPGKGASPYYPNPNSQPPPGYGAPPYYPNSQPPPGAWPPQPVSACVHLNITLGTIKLCCTHRSVSTFFNSLEMQNI